MKVSFNFDPKTKKITNLLVEEQPEINTALPTVCIEDNKLVFSKAALELIQVAAGERVAVNYWTVNNQETFPVIGKSSVFGDPENGNVLTKRGTIVFRGQNRTTLLEYGSAFLIEEFKDGMFKLVKITQDTPSVQTEEDSLDDMDNHTSELEEEINTILGDDVLPF